MFVPVREPLHLDSTLMSGQAFRWRREGQWFHGVVFDNLVKMRQGSEGIEVFSAPDDERALEPVLRDYLGLRDDLESIYASISTDERIRTAIARHRGLRILRQDPWECLASFICSSNSNIPRISKNIEDICDAFGRPVRLRDHVRATFPTPQALAEAGEERIRQLGLGYRAGYLAATARTIADGRLDLMALRGAEYGDALEQLMGLSGVGDKVANCALLFSLDKPEAFPVDVWVRRAILRWYLQGEDRKNSVKVLRMWAQGHFGPHAGYANQYLFHDTRLG